MFFCMQFIVLPKTGQLLGLPTLLGLTPLRG